MLPIPNINSLFNTRNFFFLLYSRDIKFPIKNRRHAHTCGLPIWLCGISLCNDFESASSKLVKKKQREKSNKWAIVDYEVGNRVLLDVKVITYV